MSDFDFDSALAAQVARQQEGGEPSAEATEDDIISQYGEPGDDEETTEEDEAGSIEIDEDDVVEDSADDDERPRDEKGRFVPKVAEEDPVVAEFLSRFDGDLEKALKSAAHQTDKIGRQGQELGELRQMVTQLQQMQLEATRSNNAPAPVAPGQFEEAIEEDPAAVAQWAFVNGQESVYDEAVTAWYEVDPKGASRFERALEMETLKAELSVQAPARPDASKVIAGLSEKYADFTTVVSTATPEELDGLDRDTVAELEQRNPAAAFEMVYRWVKASRPASAVTTSQDDAGSAERVEATRTAKRDAAAVARGSSRPASGDKTTMDLLKESMLSPDPFNVQQALRDGSSG